MRKLSKFDITIYAVTVIVFIITLYPVYFILIASFSDPNAVAAGHVWLLPVNLTLDGYRELLRHDEIWIGYRNTLFYTVGGTFIGLFVNLTAGFAFSRRELPGGRFLLLLYVFTMFFSGGLIPIFLTVRQLGLYNTFWVQILPFSVSAFNIIVAKSFFQNSIPDSLFDQARIDGCGNIRFFAQIALPLSKAVISVLGLWTAVGQWNSYFNALIYLKDPALFPLQLILRNILITNNMARALGTGEAAQIALRLAALMKYSIIIISTIPILCVYPFIQKYFNKGVMVGAIKG